LRFFKLLLIWEWIALLLAPFNIADTIGSKIRYNWI
jgi:hypothetical protein